MDSRRVSESKDSYSAEWTEEERLAALYRYEILDTAEEEDFEDLTRLAVQFCNAPVSLISFVDKDRQWFKAKIGTDIAETPLDVSFCKHAIGSGAKVFVIPDATKDPLFADNALVAGDPNIRFYAGAPLRTSEGLPLGTICILDFKPRDITPQERDTLETLARQVMALLEMKYALKEKKKSEERLQFALDTSAIVGTWDWDIRKDLVYADARFCRLFAVEPPLGAQGAAFDRFAKALHAEDKDRITAAVRKAVETGGEFKEEYRVVNHEGETRWIHARGRSYLDAQGRPERFPGAAVDITERKRQERKQSARAELNERLRNIRRTADVTVIASEIIGRALDCARAGYGELTRDGDKIEVERDWTNGTVASVVGTHEFKAYGEKFAQSVRNGEVIVIDDVREDPRMAEGLERLDKIGVRSLINISLIEDGRPKALFFIHDSKPRHWRSGEVELVTEMALRSWAEAERVHAEEQMAVALQKAEEANLAKTEFLANMSHEIRTPMNAIIGLSNILSSENLPPRQKEFVRTLQMSADSLLSLINDLLDISKIEARTVELEAIDFELTALIAEVISMMNVRAREKNLSFHMEGSCAQGRHFKGDPARIRQIMLNLVSNAIKFTETGGIDIHLDCIATDNPDIEDIRISVKDTGIGIPAAKLDTIFEKFVQADTSINRKYGGTGLGLAITKTLIGIMGGKIEVESRPGEGSNFIVTLPLAMARDAETLAKADTRQDPYQMNENYKKRILLVEDYAPNVLVAGTFLEEFGFEWDSAKSGHEAIDKFRSESFAAILMDVQMFGMNGLEATKIIRAYEQDNRLKRIPIIGMTAHALSGDREKCLSVGMDDYISKPFNPDDLQEKLQLLTGLSRAG